MSFCNDESVLSDESLHATRSMYGYVRVRLGVCTGMCGCDSEYVRVCADATRSVYGYVFLCRLLFCMNDTLCFRFFIRSAKRMPGN